MKGITKWGHLHTGGGFFWFRFFRNGWGFTGKDLREWGLTFSERNGYHRCLKIGHWHFKILRPVS